MDIYTAKIAADKLLDFVRTYIASEPTMYQRTKVRYTELAETCSTVSKVITTYMDSPKRRGQAASELSNASSDTSSAVAVLDPPDASQPKPASTPTYNNKQMFANYSAVLYRLSTRSTGYPVADDCTRILWDWFDTRFIKGKSPKFCYNIKMMHKWLQTIVIVFGNHHRDGTLPEFINHMDSWCMSLLDSPDSCTHAVPFQIHYASKHLSEVGVSLQSVVLWDILYDHGLKELCDCRPSEFYPSDDCVYSSCTEVSEESLNYYNNYKYDPAVLSRCQIHKYSE